MTGFDLVTAGIVLMFVGFIVLLLSIIFIVGKQGRVEGGGVVIIGPIPIVFGTNKNVTTLLLVLAIILTVLTLIVFFLPLTTYRGVP